MPKSVNLPIIILSCFMISCFPEQQALYYSPQHATTNYYKTLPLIRDSLSSATYVGAAVNLGAANHELRDGVIGFQGYLHQTRQFSRFQGYYGTGFSVGMYDIREYVMPGNGMNVEWINQRRGSHGYGSLGFHAGLNYVIPFRSRGEWRVLGIEGNFHQEFGSYYQFRKELPEFGANVVDRSNRYSSFTIHSDIIGKFSDGSTIGYKLAFTHSFRKLSGMLTNLEQVSGYPKYMSHTVHITVNKWTGYGQLNFGSDATNLQGGMVRKLASKKKLKKVYE